jgi:hypothetical protein
VRGSTMMPWGAPRKNRVDKPQKHQSHNRSIIEELQKYDGSTYFSNDQDLIAKYGPLLFFRDNEKDFPILCEMAKMIFCLVPSSSPVESILSITGNTQTKLRTNLLPTQLENLTFLKLNR